MSPLVRPAATTQPTDAQPAVPPHGLFASERRRGREAFAAALIITAFAALATAYSIVNPMYESTDELHHYRYIQYLIATGRLPVQSEFGARIQAHHPPLYYALAALASAWVEPDRAWDDEPEHNPFWQYRAFEVGTDNKNFYLHARDEDFPYRGSVLAFHIARWVNVVLGALTVWLTYRIARRLFPDRPGLALGAMALVAFNPQFLYMSGAVNNDVLASTTGAALLCAGIDAIEHPLTDRRAAALGVLFGLALLAKFNLLFMLPVIALAVWLSKDDGGRRRFVRASAIVLGMAALVSGWWFVRNQMLYGEATGVEKMNAIWGGREPLRDFALALQEIPYSWSTLWGRFGYGQIPMSDGVYRAILVVCLIALLGLIVGVVHGWRRVESGRRAQFGTLVAAVALFAGAVFGYMTISTAGPNGRFFFPALPALAVLIATGLLEWFRRSEAMASFTLIGVMLALALYGLFGILAPAYARPQPLSETQIAAISHRADITFGDSIRLVGYEVDISEVSAGGQLTVTAYWQALKPIDKLFTVFVHLTDADGVIEVQRDTYPGLGNYPTVIWQPGEVIADRYTLHVPETAYAPLETTVRVGLYERGGARLPTSRGDTSVAIGRVSIAARDLKPALSGVEGSPDGGGDFPNSTHLNFDDKVALLGYALDRRSVQPGQAIKLTTYWQALGPTDFDYAIFAHVAVAGTGTVWARSTDQPVNWTRPLSSWAKGEIVVDERWLKLDPNTPPGVYDLELGWFGSPSSKRLPILADDGHGIGTHVTLTRVRVREP